MMMPPLSEFSNSPSIEREAWEKVANKKLNWILPGEDGEKTVYAQFMDEGKNVTSVVFDKIILDRKPPAECSFTINNDSATTNNKAADVRLYMKGKDAKSILISNKKDFFGARWEAFKPFRGHWILDGEDGEKIVYMLFKDDADNMFVDTVTHKIYLDRTPPTNLSVAIKEGKIAPGMDKVTLSLKATDAEMMEIKTSESDKPVWQPYQETVEVKLPGEEKKVRIRFKDKAGNVSNYEEVTGIL